MFITLVGRHKNCLRYLVDSSGGALAGVSCNGGPSPDLLTDSLGGPIKAMAKVVTQGYGQVPAGAITQAQSRAIFNDDNSGANIGNAMIERAQLRVTPRSIAGGAILRWLVDADQVAGAPFITITTFTGDGATGFAYLDVQLEGAIGQ